jgi:hypothetical protein
VLLGFEGRRCAWVKEELVVLFHSDQATGEGAGGAECGGGRTLCVLFASQEAAPKRLPAFSSSFFGWRRLIHDSKGAGTSAAE